MKRKKRTIEYPSKKDLDKAFKEDVLDHPEYHRHITETAKLSGVSEEVARDIITHHNHSILHMIGMIRRKSILKIGVFGFLKLDVLIDPRIVELKKKKDEWINSTAIKRIEENKKK